MQHTTIQAIFDFLSAFTPKQLPGYLFLPKIILGSAGMFFLFFLIFALYKNSFLRYLLLTDIKEFFTFRAFGVQKLTKQWNAALARLDTGNEAEYKLAILEADAILDSALNRLGFRGATLGDKLKTISPVVLPSLKELEQAHGVRNGLVADPNYMLSYDQAKRTMGMYEKGFRDLDLI